MRRSDVGVTPGTPVGGRVRRGNGGAWFGAGAYVLWGAFPAFFGLLEFTDPVEILAQRILWTLVVVLAVLLLAGRLREMLEIDWRT